MGKPSNTCSATHLRPNCSNQAADFVAIPRKLDIRETKEQQKTYQESRWFGDIFLILVAWEPFADPSK
jgi:hypothetical protein